MPEQDQIIDDMQPLTRRGFARLGAAGLLAAGVGSLTLTQVFAREAKPGDDHGGHGADDPPGDDRGGKLADDPPGDDRRGNGTDDSPGDDHGGRSKGRRRR